MNYLKKTIFFFLFLLILPIFSNPSYSLQIPKDYPECFKEDTNWKTDWCPIDVKLGHRLFVVDFTSRLQPDQKAFIKDSAFGLSLIEETKPYHKISFVRVDHKSASEQKPFFFSCRMKTGIGNFKETLDGQNAICEGNNVNKSHSDFKISLALTSDDYSLIEDQTTGTLNYDKTIDLLAKNHCKALKKKCNEQEIEKLKKQIYKHWDSRKFFPSKYTPPSGSYIYETLIEVLRNKEFDFSNKYPERELIIASDLVQISKRFSLSHTKGYCKPKVLVTQKKKYCGDLKGLLKNKVTRNYLEQTKLDKKLLENLKVKVLFLNHNYSCETNPKAAESMQKLWVELFNYMGISNVKWVWQLDPNTKPNCK
mgnify:FL=1|jgi:hypothetical protein